MLMNNYDGMISNKELVKIDVEEFLGIYQPINTRIMQDAKINEIILELQEKANQILCQNSSSFSGGEYQ